MIMPLVLALAAVTVSVPVKPTPAAAAHAAWLRSGRPDRLVVLRPASVDLVSKGKLSARVWRAGGPATLSWLTDTVLSGGYVPGPKWASRTGNGMVKLAAPLLLAPDASLRIGGRVQLAEGAWIRAGRSRLEITDAELTATGSGSYLLVGAGGRLDLTHSKVTGLSQVTWGKGGTGSAIDTDFTRTGVQLVGSDHVQLRKVDIDQAPADGLVLRGDRQTSLTSVRSTANKGHGVIITGSAPHRTLRDLNTSGNGLVGILAKGQHDLVAGALTATDGLRLTDCVDCTVATPKTSMLAITGRSSRVQVTGAVADGVSVTAPASQISLTDLTVGAAGVALSGSDVQLQNSTVAAKSIGVRVYGPAGRVALNGVTIRGGKTGVTVGAKAQEVTLTGVQVFNVSDNGVRSASPGLRMTGGLVSYADAGVALYASAVLDGVHVDNSRQGIRVEQHVTASGVRLDVLALKMGIKVRSGGHFTLTDSRVRAPLSIIGDVEHPGRNTLTLPPFPWFGAIGIGALLLAIALEAVHRVRQRQELDARRIPTHVTNTV